MLARFIHASAKSFHSTLGSLSVDVHASFQKELALKLKRPWVANDRKTCDHQTVLYGLNYQVILFSAQVKQAVSHSRGLSEPKRCAVLG
jgi:hypothetical protein